MIRKIIFLILITTFLLGAVFDYSHAQEKTTKGYQLLEPLGSKTEKVDLASYVDKIVKIAIIVAALLAVIQIVVAGLMYVSAGGNSGTIGSAKTKIWDALVGLLIATGFYIILYAINPDMLKIDNIIPKIGDGDARDAPTQVKMADCIPGNCPANCRKTCTQGTWHQDICGCATTRTNQGSELTQ